MHGDICLLPLVPRTYHIIPVNRNCGCLRAHAQTRIMNVMSCYLPGASFCSPEPIICKVQVLPARPATNPVVPHLILLLEGCRGRGAGDCLAVAESEMFESSKMLDLGLVAGHGVV